jgi:hypothetical protein
MASTLPPDAAAFVGRAARYLESSPLHVKLLNVLGRPVELVLDELPERWKALVHGAANRALVSAMDWATRSLPPGGAPRGERAARRLGVRHQMLAAASGAAGGLVGLPGLALELPLTTMVMLRSIAAIAHELGADLHDPTVRLDCVSVFALGGTSPDDDALDSAYYATRFGLALEVREASRFLARTTGIRLTQAIENGSAPVLVRLLGRIASRFEGVVLRKVASQAVPAIGAAGGLGLNLAFASHFNQVATFHFGLRRLETIHGEDTVRTAYAAALAQRRTPRVA